LELLELLTEKKIRNPTVTFTSFSFWWQQKHPDRSSLPAYRNVVIDPPPPLLLTSFFIIFFFFVQENQISN